MTIPPSPQGRAAMAIPTRTTKGQKLPLLTHRRSPLDDWSQSEITVAMTPNPCKYKNKTTLTPGTGVTSGPVCFPILRIYLFLIAMRLLLIWEFDSILSWLNLRTKVGAEAGKGLVYDNLTVSLHQTDSYGSCHCLWKHKLDYYCGCLTEQLKPHNNLIDVSFRDYWKLYES